MAWLEIMGVILAVIGVVLTTLEDRNCWLINILASILYLKIFYDSDLLGQMILQLLFVLVGVIGYLHWHESNQVKIKYLGWPILSVVVFASIFAGYLLHSANSKLLLADAVLTIAGVMATYLTTKKFIESWILWAIINVCSVVLFSYKALYITALLYCLYGGLSVIGYKRWSKQLKC